MGLKNLLLRIRGLKPGIPAIVEWAHWAVDNHGSFVYTEGGDRWYFVEGHPVHDPGSRRADCSSFVTGLYRHSNVRQDPNNAGWRFGDTATLAAHGKLIPNIKKVIPGDLLLCGLDLPLSGQHVMVVVENKPVGGIWNPLCVSHGRQGDPELVRASVDSRSHTYMRYPTASSNPEYPR